MYQSFEINFKYGSQPIRVYKPGVVMLLLELVEGPELVVFPVGSVTVVKFAVEGVCVVWDAAGVVDTDASVEDFTVVALVVELGTSVVTLPGVVAALEVKARSTGEH